MIDERIRKAVKENPGAMTMQLARELGVPEVEVVRALPEGRAVELDAARWEEVFRALESQGKMHVIVSNRGATLESVGEFGGFSTWGEFFNVQTSSLDMHIRWPELAAIFAIEKPSHMNGRPTESLQFFDRGGAAALKVFLDFGTGPAQPERKALFQELRGRYRKQAP